MCFIYSKVCVQGTVLDTGDTAALRVVRRKVGGWGEETENRQNKINIFRDDHDLD